MRAALSCVLLLGLVATACKKDGTDPAAATVSSATLPDGDAPAVEISKSAKLAAIGMMANVYATPKEKATKIGYLRLGAVVSRSEKSHWTDGCPGGWYGVAPKGFVCVGKHAS